MSDVSPESASPRRRRTWVEGHRARLAWLQERVDQWWYLPSVAIAAGLDTFVLCFPTDVFLISSCTLRPRRWLRIACGIALGSAVGALLFAYAVHSSAPWVHGLVGWAVVTPGEVNATASLVARYSVFALLLTALNPLLPLQPAIAVAVLAGMDPLVVFLWVLAGRLLKYIVYGFIAARAPHLLARWFKREQVVRDDVQAASVAKAERPGP